MTEIQVQFWNGLWSNHEFMSDLYQDIWTDISPDGEIMEIWI